jgi:hypothetical protein
MVLNKLAFTALGAACIIAASAGGYVALRQNATSTATTPQAAEAVDAGPAVSVGAQAAVPASPSGHPAQQPETLVSRTLPADNTVATAPAPAKPATPIVTAPPKRAAKPEPVLASRTSAPAPSDRPWSNAAASAPAPPPAPVPQTSPESAASPLRPGETVIVAQDPTPLPEPAAQKSYEELVVSADSVIGLQSETSVSSERARVEDRVEARVTRDVRVGNRVAIPAGSRAIGVVSQVERGGKFKEHARLAIRFQTVVLADGTRLPISTDAVIREGAAPSDESAKKIGGGAVAGTILGAILGGAKGAAIGGMAGAGAGAGVVAAGDRAAATLHAGEPITIRLLSPVTITSER